MTSIFSQKISANFLEYKHKRQLKEKKNNLQLNRELKEKIKLFLSFTYFGLFMFNLMYL